MLRPRRLRTTRTRFPAARIGQALVVLAVLGILGMEAYRYQLQRQVDDARRQVEKTRAEADALEARARQLEPLQPMVDRALAGILDPAGGNLSHQQLSPLLAASRASGVQMVVVAAGNGNRVGPFHGRTLTLQIQGREPQILQFLREMEQARPLIRVVAWNSTLDPSSDAGTAGKTAGAAAAGDLSAQFTILFYHR